MFEITGDDISLLNDTDLRALIGRLCEAELRRQGYPVSYVTWGGNQTAKDGGLDVHVALPPSAAISGFISRPETGYQVKKPDMPRGEILDEMKPDGVVRPVIAELAKGVGRIHHRQLDRVYSLYSPQEPQEGHGRCGRGHRRRFEASARLL